jgi:YjbE family integral membrane protein
VFELGDFTALLGVVLIDLALAGDNAVAVGLAASALPAQQQKRAIFWGIILALILRIVFATAVMWLLGIKGIVFCGGLLLLWVAWRMWEDIKAHRPVTVGDPVASEHLAEAITNLEKAPPTFARALLTIIIADVSMSLDNVLAVASVARHSNPWILWFGLVLSVVLMGVAASIIARVIEKYRWIAIAGVVVIVFAAIRMIWEDSHSFLPSLVPAMPTWLGGHGV